jgi:hypothetical protein
VGAGEIGPGQHASAQMRWRRDREFGAEGKESIARCNNRCLPWPYASEMQGLPDFGDSDHYFNGSRQTRCHLFPAQSLRGGEPGWSPPAAVARITVLAKLHVASGHTVASQAPYHGGETIVEKGPAEAHGRETCGPTKWNGGGSP